MDSSNAYYRNETAGEDTADLIGAMITLLRLVCNMYIVYMMGGGMVLIMPRAPARRAGGRRIQGCRRGWRA